MPVYLVETPNGKRLIRAKSQHTALNFVVKKDVTVKPVTPDTLLDLTDKKGGGMIVEVAYLKKDDEAEKKASIERIADEVTVDEDPDGEDFIPPEPKKAKDMEDPVDETEASE